MTVHMHNIYKPSTHLYLYLIHNIHYELRLKKYKIINGSVHKYFFALLLLYY